jgi:hypothetical protein
MNKQKFYPWYNPKNHTAVFPIHSKGMDLKNRLVWQLEQIGVELLESIDMPVSVVSELQYGKLPDWLHFVEADDYVSSQIWDFADNKDRIRLRTIVFGIGMMSTHVMTRYFVNETLAPNHNIEEGIYFPAAFDAQYCEEDDFSEDDMPEPIWMSEEPGEYLHDLRLPEAWLDENYPCWRDPMRYWD